MARSEATRTPILIKEPPPPPNELGTGPRLSPELTSLIVSAVASIEISEETGTRMIKNSASVYIVMALVSHNRMVPTK